MVSFEVTDVKWVERFVVGSSDPRRAKTEAEIAAQLERVNSELRYGKIISIETNLNSCKIDHCDVVAQYTVYHIGYKSKPHGR